MGNVMSLLALLTTAPLELIYVLNTAQECGRDMIDKLLVAMHYLPTISVKTLDTQRRTHLSAARDRMKRNAPNLIRRDERSSRLVASSRPSPHLPPGRSFITSSSRKCLLGSWNQHRVIMSVKDWKGADTSYLHNIQAHCRRHPSLKLLNALPHVPEHPTRMKVLEFRDIGITTADITGLPDLDTYWSNIENGTPDSSTTEEEAPIPPCKGRLYLVEDISLPFISSLGSHFNIDPRFFVEYLKYDPDRTQNFLDGYHTMRRLSSLSHTYHHATFVYHEIRTFLGIAPRREEFEIVTRDNVRRLMTTVGK